MDGQRFDATTRTIGRTTSRRQVVRAAAGGLLALLGRRAVAAGDGPVACPDGRCQDEPAAGCSLGTTACGTACCGPNEVCIGPSLPPDARLSEEHSFCACPYPFLVRRDGSCICPDQCGEACCAPEEECCDGVCCTTSQVCCDQRCVDDIDYVLCETHPPEATPPAR